MKIRVNDKDLSSITVSPYEYAWAIADALEVLDYFHSTKQLVLGGDILTTNLQHNYDSWYYNVDQSKDDTFNLNSSIETAKSYISKYIRDNGSNYYVVIVVK